MRLPRLAFAAALLLVPVAAPGAATLVPFASFGHTGAIVDWTVPETGTWQIVATGAQGGRTDQSFDPSYLSMGGRGARMGGLFDLTVGTVLQVAVGGAGATTEVAGAGGGGSFVVAPGDTPLVVAGGGGSGAIRAERLESRGGAFPFWIDASTSEAAWGTNGFLLTSFTGEGAPSQGDHAGGGGWNSDGGSGFSGTGGASWFNGLAGGRQSDSCGDGSHGGFGGGGAGGTGGSGCSGGGGGGGWSGGPGGSLAGGGGSFFNTTLGYGTALFPLIAEAGIGYGHGLVTFAILREDSVTPVPEPASLALLGLALAGLRGRARPTA